MSSESTIKEIISLLEENVHEDLKRPFYFGDPLQVPSSMLPTVAVDMVSGESPQGPTGHDEQLETLQIKVLVDKRPDLGRSSGKVVALEELIKFVEEVDSSTGRYKTNTILGVLRKNLSLEKTSIGNDISWEYGVLERQNILTAECWITINVKKIIEVQNRT
jgi:hypothetical protein